MPGLYIHIPFCKKRCFYCDFTTYTSMESSMGPYIEALEKEIEGRMAGIYPETIFIGGGTPTSLDDKSFAHLMKVVGKYVVSPEQEVTIEANPESISDEKIKMMKTAGINRVSMGLQSTDDLILKNIGRIHNYKTFLKSFHNLREAGFTNLSFDLITALPGQDEAIILDTVEKAIALDPEHLSVYSMILEEGTPFFEKFAAGLLELPDDDEDRNFQDLFRERLEAAGYDRYEISNFSKKGLVSRHNLNYWNFGEYLGCGVAASGFMNGRRWTNTTSIPEYIEAIDKGEDPSVSIHVNSLEDSMEEFIFMGLRKTKGISTREFSDRFGQDFYKVYPGVCDRFVENKLMIIDGDEIRLTNEGLDLSNYIMSDFILTESEE